MWYIVVVLLVQPQMWSQPAVQEHMVFQTRSECIDFAARWTVDNRIIMWCTGDKP